jgi:hypothetical protein
MLTEEEAKTKACCAALGLIADIALMVRTHVEGSFPGGTFGIEKTALCGASACMAWRSTDNKTFPSAPGETPRPSEPAGYCGLAGKPND